MDERESLRQRIRRRLTEQRGVVQELLRIREQVPGSLLVRYARCGKPSCACREGAPHGPYYVLSTRSRGQGDFTYVDPEAARRLRVLLRDGRAYRRGLLRLRRLNLDLVALLRRYRAVSARRTSRELPARRRGGREKAA